MKFFDRYTSATVAGSGNQCACFYDDADEVRVSRVYYRLNVSGKQSLALLYSNTIDTTFADGSISRKNRVCGEWHIHSLKAGICFGAAMDRAADPDVFTAVTFGGSAETDVLPGALFATDPFELYIPEDSYLCVEMAFSGGLTPCFPESIIPGFVRKADRWQLSMDFPFPSMVGCARAVKMRVAYLGDSITEGIGTADNSYTHWNAVVSEKLGPENAYWNLGIGYARAYDAAADGMWLYKARRNDAVVLCLGVNDILSGESAEDIKHNLEIIVCELKKAGCLVVVQTVPPFDYPDPFVPVWKEVNRYILEELSLKADGAFDTVPVLCGDKPQNAKYGGHPDAEGCVKWGEALAPIVKKVIEEK